MRGEKSWSLRRPGGRAYLRSMLHTVYVSITGREAIHRQNFAEEEDRIGNVAPVVLISHSLWRRRFGSDSSIVGQTVMLNQVSTTIIGVLPTDFRLFRDPNVPTVWKN